MMERTGGGGAGNALAPEHYNPSLSSTALSRRASAAFTLAAVLLLALRLPSLVQPMGADQGLYAYIGERILHGERPYVDAWDQKPPAIHYTYALMRWLWASDAVVPAADLLAAAAAAAGLFVIGRRLASPRVGAAAALILLLLSNPAFTRLNGVRVRAQCETFIALAVTAALVALVRQHRRALAPYALAGFLFGVAVAFKYNAGVYAAAALVTLFAAGALTWARTGAFLAAAAVAPLAFLLVFAGALAELYAATIEYNLRYSGETYSGPGHFLAYLLTFPIDRARDDALWTVGGAGCLVLLVGSLRDRRRLVPVVWVASACLSIAINGSRGLPQYFVQAGPALALAAAWGAWVLVRVGRASLPATAARAAIAVAGLLVAVAVWRVNQFPKLLEQTAFDASHALGRSGRDEYLGRYADPRKYSALAAMQIGRFLQEHSAPDQAVYLFGFTGSGYVYADRRSASRFFWSRPVIAGFNAGRPGYGEAGLMADLERTNPPVIALQVHDWEPDVENSASYFLSSPALGGWLRAHYQPAPGPEGFDVWLRRE